jgi:hypothetical protein
LARPTKYKEQYCELLIEHMTAGADFRSFAGKVGVTEATLYAWKKANPKFEEAAAIALEKAYFFWEALARKYLFVRKDEERIDTGMFVLNMRNRFKWLSKDKEPVPGLDAPSEDEIYATWERTRSER